MEIKYENPLNFYPVHEIRDKNKLQSLKEEIKNNGWRNCPPLVLFENIHLMSGAHRWAVAVELGKEIPVITLAGIFEEAGIDYEDSKEESGYNRQQEDNYHAYPLSGVEAIVAYLPECIREKYGIDIG